MNNLKVCVVSSFNNSIKYIDRFLHAIFSLEFPSENIFYHFLENDSQDDTFNRLSLLSLENAKVKVSKLENKKRDLFPNYYSFLGYLHASIQAKILEDIDGSDYILWIDSDVIKIDPLFLSKSINLVSNKVKAICPMVLMEGNGANIFYDTAGFKINGKNFSNFYPFFESYEKGRLFKIDSGGVCFLFEHDLFPLKFEGERLGNLNSAGIPIIHWNFVCEDIINRGYEILLDTDLEVFHINHAVEGLPIFKKWS